MRASRVFVSHTSDLANFPTDRSFVAAVLDSVVRAGMAPVDMRYFAARDGQPSEYCQQRVRDCDLYVGVVGFRYGSLVPGEVVSYTELEFIEAGAAGLRRLMFLLDETVEGPADADRTKIGQFRRRISEAGLICAGFTTADGLELAVFQALRELAGADARAVPRQLPAAVPYFAGRTAELTALTGLLRSRADVGGSVVISAIGGTAGVGKTALAVHWAYQIADRFPDGQLYVNLRGFDPAGAAMEPADAVRRFLVDGLNVPPERIPADLDAQAALYRSQLAGRRMLVVLDNARDTAQVRPLLPGAPTCLALITSRNQLTGLIAVEGAQPISLDVFTPDEARQLLTRRVGAERVAADSEAAAEIISGCARLPLALALVAARVAVRPNVELHEVANELSDTHQRWETLTGDDPASDLRAVFSWSYDALAPAAARLFRLLGLHPGPDISTPAAASLAALSLAQVRLLLAELARANLLLEHAPSRYTFHDLLRAYAASRARDDAPQPNLAPHTATRVHRATANDQALDRLLDYYQRTAARAANALSTPGRHGGSAPGTRAPTNPAEATAWLRAERGNLLACIQHARGSHQPGRALDLTTSLTTLLLRDGPWTQGIDLQQQALSSLVHHPCIGNREAADAPEVPPGHRPARSTR
jgi:Domain of unknown function (DUF4062)/NB-ARC domain